MMTHKPDYSTLPINTYEFAFPVIKQRENPFEVVKKISEDIGPRPVTSIAEAQAAAFIGGRLRRAGMQVWTDPFQATTQTGTGAFTVTILAAAVIVLWADYREYALASAVVACIVAVLTMSQRFLLIGRREHESQNVIATLSPLAAPTRRVVILTPLDSHQPADPFSNKEARVGATAALLTFACIEFFVPFDIPELARMLILALPAVYLVIAASSELWTRMQPYSPGAVSYGGSLATMLTAVEDVGRLPKTEIWVVGLGGGTTGAGLRHLMKRYPFDRRATFFIGLEGIGRGSLSYIMNDISERQRSADKLLVNVITEATLGVRAEPRIAASPVLIRPLIQTGCRAIAIGCLDNRGKVPLQGSAKDTISAVNLTLIEQAARLVANTMRAIDASDISVS
jgi:hypothetical protein